MPKWSANPNIVMREEDDGMHLAFNVVAGSGIILNPVSYFIWSRALEDLTPDAIAESVRREFDFPQGAPAAERMLEIVSTHLTLLEQTRLLVEEPVTANEGADAPVR